MSEPMHSNPFNPLDWMRAAFAFHQAQVEVAQQYFEAGSKAMDPETAGEAQQQFLSANRRALEAATDFARAHLAWADLWKT